MSTSGTNWAKIGGAIVLVLGLVVAVFPIPLQYVVYVNGTALIINGLLHYWYGTPSGSQPVAAKPS